MKNQVQKTSPSDNPIYKYLSSPLAIYPNVLKLLVNEGKLTSADVNTKSAEIIAKENPSIAMIKMHGVLVPHLPPYYDDSYYSGSYVSPQSLMKRFKAAADNKDVKEIFVDVHSPGGVAMCIDELADTVGYASSLKPVIACINGYGASAGYWAIARATELYATRLSPVGSIGVITSHADYSKLLEEEGIDYKYYRTGDLKALGQIIDPNDDVMRAAIMKDLNDTLAIFANDVALGRKMSAEEVLDRYALNSEHPNALRGNTVLGEEAIALGLVDGVSNPMDVLAKMVTRISKSSKLNFASVKKGAKMDGNGEGANIEQALADARKTEASRIASVLGITGELKDSDLTALLKQAQDGKAYRASLLERLRLSTVSLAGGAQSEADATRTVRIFADASIEDLEAEVKVREDRVSSLVPNGQISKADEATKNQAVDLSGV
jgi:signal peptide peptidase SppA